LEEFVAQLRYYPCIRLEELRNLAILYMYMSGAKEYMWTSETGSDEWMEKTAQ
jgi:hypothetical protein